MGFDTSHQQVSVNSVIKNSTSISMSCGDKYLSSSDRDKLYILSLCILTNNFGQTRLYVTKPKSMQKNCYQAASSQKENSRDMLRAPIVPKNPRISLNIHQFFSSYSANLGVFLVIRQSQKLGPLGRGWIVGRMAENKARNKYYTSR